MLKDSNLDVRPVMRLDTLILLLQDMKLLTLICILYVIINHGYLDIWNLVIFK